MLELSKRSRAIEYDHQNYFQLACIQSATVGYPSMLVGQFLSKTYTPAIALISIIIGNFILWLIGIGMISMVNRKHTNAIENIRNYTGKTGSSIFAFVLLISFLNWSAFQISTSTDLLNEILDLNKKWGQGLTIKIGASLGLLLALFSMGGIRFLKKTSVFCLPILFFYTIYAIFSSDFNFPSNNYWTISFPAIAITVLSLLPGYVNFPTFFRHSRSTAHSYFALTLITILTSFFQISTIWMNFSKSNYSTLTGLILATIIIVLMLTCVNLLNIYLASACLETIVPRFSSAKGYAIIGLLGTMTYTFLQISAPVRFLEDITNSYIAILGMILLMAFLLKIVVKHRPRPLEKALNMSTWILGCIVSTVYEINHPFEGVDALMTGVRASLLFFLIVLFCEEVVWASQKKWGTQAGVNSR